jgi:DNA gyrase/topoisomerase IV subunit B
MLLLKTKVASEHGRPRLPALDALAVEAQGSKGQSIQRDKGLGEMNPSSSGTPP